MTHSIYENAKNILEILHKNAAKMKTETDLEQNPWLSDEYQEKYDARHKAIFKFEDSGLSREQFYAACELIERSCSSIREVMEEKIELHCSQGSEQLLIQAKNSDRIRALNAFDTIKLPAPIALVPFALIIDQLSKPMEVYASAIWDQPAGADGLVTHQFKDEKIRNIFLKNLQAIEACCKELDKSFSLNIRYGFSAGSTCKISLNKEQLGKSRILFFNDVDLVAKEESKSVQKSSFSVRGTLFAKAPVMNVAPVVSDCAPGGPSFR